MNVRIAIENLAMQGEDQNNKLIFTYCLQMYFIVTVSIGSTVK